MAGKMSIPWILGVIDDGIVIELECGASLSSWRPLENNLTFWFFSLTAHNLCCPLAKVDECRRIELVC